MAKWWGNPEMVIRKCITRGCKDTVSVPHYWRNWLKCWTCVFGPSKEITHITIEDGVCENSSVPIVEVVEVKKGMPTQKEIEEADWQEARPKIKAAIKSWFKKQRHKKAA